MPEQERFVPVSDTSPSKGTSMYSAGKTPKFAPSTDVGDAPMPIGKFKGQKIKDVTNKDLKTFMTLYNNLNKIAALPAPPPNYSAEGSPLRKGHEDMKAYVEANGLEQQMGDAEQQKAASTTPIEKTSGDEAFRVPDGFADDLIGPAERGDIRKIGTNRMNVLLSKLRPSDLERNPDFVDLIKTYVSQTGGEDQGMITGNADTVPTGIFMGEPAKFVRKFGGQPVASLEPKQLASLHMYFNYNLYKDAPNKFKAHKGFYDAITQTLVSDGTIREMDGQYLYPNDIIFYEKYKNSQPVGSVGDDAFPIEVQVVQKPNPRYFKTDKAGTPYYQWLFTEMNTPNVIEYRDYTPPHSKQKDHEGLNFDHEMMGIRNANAAAIEAEIAYQNVYKGVMRTRIKSPVFIEVIKGGGRKPEPVANPEDIAADARKQDDSIRRNKELNQMIPKDTQRNIEKGVQRDMNDKDQTDKLGNLVDKYKGESVKKKSPQLNEHVQKMLNISNYKRVIK